MRVPSFFTLALIGAGDAFPNVLGGISFGGESEKAIKRQAAKTTPPFDQSLQYVDTTGDYAFVPPGNGDQRGPCPGLNALANQYVP